MRPVNVNKLLWFCRSEMTQFCKRRNAVQFDDMFSSIGRGVVIMLRHRELLRPGIDLERSCNILCTERIGLTDDV